MEISRDDNIEISEEGDENNEVERSQSDGWFGSNGSGFIFYTNHTSMIYHIEIENFMKINCSQVIAYRYTGILHQSSSD